MRRGISIFLTLLFGMGPLLSALPGTEDARLPACCRRHGAHHCAMAAQMPVMAVESNGTTSVTAPSTCPYYPGPTVALLIPAYALTAEAEPLVQLETSLRVLLPADPAHPRGPSRTRAGRGPPASFPS